MINDIDDQGFDHCFGEHHGTTKQSDESYPAFNTVTVAFLPVDKKKYGDRSSQLQSKTSVFDKKQP